MPINRIRAVLSVYGRHIEFFLTIAALILAGGVIGYTLARIEAGQAIVSQEARHSADIAVLRNERNLESREMRKIMGDALNAAVTAAVSAGEAARQLKAMAEELGPEQTRAARRAADASRKAIEASNIASEAAKSALQSERQAGRILAPAEPYRRQ